jgi:hypothetical protein
VAQDFAYELRQFIKTDRDLDRLKASTAALCEFESAGDDPEALRAFVDGSGQDALQAFCLPFMSFSRAPSGDYGFWPDIEGLDHSARSKDGIIKVNAGDTWPPLWTTEGRDVQFVMEVNDHGNVTLYNRRRQEVWSCV